jgi:hypothetical protein
LVAGSSRSREQAGGGKRGVTRPSSGYWWAWAAGRPGATGRPASGRRRPRPWPLRSRPGQRRRRPAAPQARRRRPRPRRWAWSWRGRPPADRSRRRRRPAGSPAEPPPCTRSPPGPAVLARCAGGWSARSPPRRPGRPSAGRDATGRSRGRGPGRRRPGSRRQPGSATTSGRPTELSGGGGGRGQPVAPTRGGWVGPSRGRLGPGVARVHEVLLHEGWWVGGGRRVRPRGGPGWRRRTGAREGRVQAGRRRPRGRTGSQ